MLLLKQSSIYMYTLTDKKLSESRISLQRSIILPWNIILFLQKQFKLYTWNKVLLIPQLVMIKTKCLKEVTEEKKKNNCIHTCSTELALKWQKLKQLLDPI